VNSISEEKSVVRKKLLRISTSQREPRNQRPREKNNLPKLVTCRSVICLAGFFVAIDSELNGFAAGELW
jgi:hypothetical protein